MQKIMEEQIENKYELPPPIDKEFLWKYDYIKT